MRKRVRKEACLALGDGGIVDFGKDPLREVPDDHLALVVDAFEAVHRAVLSQQVCTGREREWKWDQIKPCRICTRKIRRPRFGAPLTASSTCAALT